MEKRDIEGLWKGDDLLFRVYLYGTMLKVVPIHSDFIQSLTTSSFLARFPVKFPLVSVMPKREYTLALWRGGLQWVPGVLLSRNWMRVYNDDTGPVHIENTGYTGWWDDNTDNGIIY